MRLKLTLSSHYEDDEAEYVSPGLGIQGKTEGEFARRFELGEVIGQGTFSIVRLAICKETGAIYACKIVDKRTSFGGVARLREEIKILLSVREHSNIVTLHDVFESEHELLLLFDLAQGGELFDRIVEKQRYSEEETRKVITSLLEAAVFLHARNVVHRDIKPENILLCSSQSHTRVMISDFGLAKVLEEDGAKEAFMLKSDSCSSLSTDEAGLSDGEDMYEASEGEEVLMVESDSSCDLESLSYVGRKRPRKRAYTDCGTDSYVAPEVLKGKGYDAKVDMWSIGVVMYILLSGYSPFLDDDTDDNFLCDGPNRGVQHRIMNGMYTFDSPRWNSISKSAKSLVRALLTVDPANRIGAEEALKHPWITGGDKM